MRPWIDLNVNARFKPNSFKKVGEGWIPQWEPLTLNQPYVDRQSSRMGVRERHFQTRLRQTGTFIDDSNIVRALQEELRRAVDRVLSTTPTCTIKTDLPVNFKDEDYGRENGEKEALDWMPFLIVWRKLSTAMNSLKWTIRFNCPSPKSIMPLGELANHAGPNRVMPHFKH